jgi:NADPH:quinone reductase-like Zn-dependent oxidoreductase
MMCDSAHRNNHPWRTYPLARAAQAHADLEARRNHGKIVLLP